MKCLRTLPALLVWQSRQKFSQFAQALVTLAFYPSPLTWIAAQYLSVVPLDPFTTPFPLAIILCLSFFLSSTLVTDCQASSTAHLLYSCRLVSSDWHSQCVPRTDLPACIALLLKFLCQIPNEESVAGSAWLAGLFPLACLMKRTPVGFIIKELLITDGERGVMKK